MHGFALAAQRAVSRHRAPSADLYRIRRFPSLSIRLSVRLTVTQNIFVEAARYYFFPSICLYYTLPSKIINVDNKKKRKEAKQDETTKIVPLRGMKEIKKRASDDIQVNVRNVRNRTIAKCHRLYTQGGKRSAVVPEPQLMGGCRN